MFKCNRCKKTTQSAESATKVVTQRRNKTYENLVRGKPVISEGWEIVKEVMLCKECGKGVQNG